MTEKAKEAILPHVRGLIKCITHLKPGDDKFSHYEHHVLSNIWHNKFIDVDRYAVRKSIDGIIKKFIIHSRLEEADKLKGLVDKFLNSKDFENNPQYDIQWCLLSLLLHLSHNPTSATCSGSQTIQVGPVEEEEEFDWPAYLLEGQQDFTYLNGGSETDDECYSSDELQEDYSCMSEEVFSFEKEVTQKQLGESCRARGVENVSTKGILWGCIEERANASEKWLKENVQSPSVVGYKAISKFASANLAEFWEAQQKGKTDNTLPTQLLSEYRILREVLWALQVPPSSPSYLQDDWKGLFLFDGKDGYRVQPSLTIPSLTKGSFQSHLSWLGRHVSLVRVLENFISEVFSTKVIAGSAQGDERCLPPHTYEVYASALKDFLSFFKERVLTIEKKVKAQESTCTLLTVSQELEPLLKELRLVHGIHQKSICNWEQNSNWYCACRLLTMTYGALLSSLTDVDASICFKIFLKTLQPYLEIIHVWLTEGRLEDWRGEFIITKNEALCGNGENFWKEGFVVHPYEDALLEEEGGLGKGIGSGFPLGLLNLIEEKVLLLGKNMELLQRLDRLSEFQKSSPFFEGTLHSVLKHTLECNLGLYTKEEEGEEISSHSQEFCDCTSSTPDIVSHTPAQELQNSEDYYLKKTFEDIFLLSDDASHSHSKETVCCHKSENSKNKRLAVPVLLPIKPMIERQLCKLLDEHHSMSSTIVRSVLLGEFALTSHLLTMRRIFLMEAGDLIHHFCTHLFQQAEVGEKWEDSLSLTNYLQECVSARYPDAASCFSISLSMPVESNAPAHPTNSNASVSTGSGETWLDQVDRIRLNYAVEWPINIVLNVASMESYNTVFQFLLKVKWALWSLQQLRFSDLTGTKTSKVPQNMAPEEDCDTMPMSAKIHRLQLLRAWLLHFVGSVHAYLMGRVLHGLGMKLESDLESASDLDAIIHVHEKYLETVYCQCLQPKTADIFKTAIIRVLDISMTLSTLWKQPTQLTSGRLCEMENQYIRCHVFLANVLTNAVQQGFVRHRGFVVQQPILLPPSSSRAGFLHTTPSTLSTTTTSSSSTSDHSSCALYLVPETSRYTYTLLSWQRSSPSGFQYPLPAALVGYLDSKLWSSFIRMGLRSMRIILDVFLNDFFAFYDDGHMSVYQELFQTSTKSARIWAILFLISCIIAIAWRIWRVLHRYLVGRRRGWSPEDPGANNLPFPSPVPTKQLFLVVLALSDAAGLHFLYFVKDKGSWLDIGSSLPHFVILETMVLFLLFLYGLSCVLIPSSILLHSEPSVLVNTSVKVVLNSLEERENRKKDKTHHD